jgi:NAD(P)-dependent dehydrogenase (short-subunit alcohol dehydrogenase family)
MAMSVWFITGASRGFGLEITRAALGRGDQVVATARRPEAIAEAVRDPGTALLTLPLDVTDAGKAAAAVSAAVARFGRIDSLVNDAGRGLLGAVEEVSDAEARAVFEVNVFGLLTVTRAVLPVMRGQRAGTIINISSSGGFIGRPGWGVYCSTKFAVEGLTESVGRSGQGGTGDRGPGLPEEPARAHPARRGLLHGRRPEARAHRTRSGPLAGGLDLHQLRHLTPPGAAPRAPAEAGQMI